MSDWSTTRRPPDHRERWIPAADAADPRQLTRAVALAQGMFHGTPEPLTGPLHGGIDSLFWTAATPALAQTYLPEHGLTQYWSTPSRYERDNPTNPTNLDRALARQLEWECTIHEADHVGRAKRWRWTRDGVNARGPTRGEIADYVCDTLGYAPKHGAGTMVALKLARERHDQVAPRDIVLPANHQRPGRLITLLPTTPIRCYDLASDREGDLQTPDHQQYALFQLLEQDGWDAVRINDFCQSPSMGNYGHHAIGLFPRGLAKVTPWIRPAVHFDVGAHRGVAETPAWIDAHTAWVRDAVNAGRPVPPRVLADYPDLAMLSAVTAAITAPPADAPGPTTTPPQIRAPANPTRRHSLR